MNYQETLDFLYSQLPMYQRQGAIAFKKDLTNTFKLCHTLDDPQLNFKSIHIAGTNGKGSTAHILSAIYSNNGYKTGLYTSPHLVDFRERIRINGAMIDKRSVIQFVQNIKKKISDIKPSFFEMTVAMAFDFFSKQEVDIAIIETGLGGRLDSTNVIIPELSVITSVSLDHTDMLGETIEDIASEKAGIIKNHIPVITGFLPEVAEEIVKSTAHARQSLYYNAIKIPHRLTNKGLVPTDLNGEFQQLNIKTALIAVDALQEVLPTFDDKTLDALIQIRPLSGLRGRGQVIQDKPLVICDVAHNVEGLGIALYELDKHKGEKHFILGFVKEKNLEDIIPLFPKSANYYFIKPEIPRGMNAIEAMDAFYKSGRTGKTFENIQSALNHFNEALNSEQIPSDAVLFVGGSNFTVADLLKLNSLKIG